MLPARSHGWIVWSGASQPVGALMVSCAGSFLSDATPTVTSSAVVTSTRLRLHNLSPLVPKLNIVPFDRFLGGDSLQMLPYLAVGYPSACSGDHPLRLALAAPKKVR